MQSQKTAATTIVGTLTHFRRQGEYCFLVLRDPEDRTVQIQAIQKDAPELRYRLGDVLMLEVNVRTDERAPEHLSFDVQKAVVVYRPLWLAHAWRQARFIWWNRMNLQTALQANH